MRAIVVVAARPNFMKVKPILDAFAGREDEVLLVHTGQHYDTMMSDVFFEDLGIRAPDVHLGVGSGGHAAMTAATMVAFDQVLVDWPPDWVVVVGDVNATVATALTAAKRGVKVAHVEAGLRSGDWSMPEEVNRVVTDRVSDLLLAPSQDGVENLRAEGADEDAIRLVGNVMVDTLRTNASRARDRAYAAELGLGERYALATLHRPSNVDAPEVLEGIFGALLEVSASIPVVLPAHPRSREALDALNVGGSVRLIDPVGYLDFLSLMTGASLVLTDSGGIQEETTALGVPCLTLRENTERPITVTEGTNRVVGVDRQTIVDAAVEVLEHPPTPRCPDLWDGNAGVRVVAALREHAGQPATGPRNVPAGGAADA